MRAPTIGARARAILDARPNDWDTRRALAYALEAAGDADGALAIWRAEAQRIPADPEVYRAWFDLLEAQARPALADDALHPLTRVGRRAEPHATLPPPLLHDPRYAMLFDHIHALEPLAEADHVMAAWAARAPAPLTLARAYWYAISRGDRRTAARYLDAHLNLVPDESDWHAILRTAAARDGVPFVRPRSRWRDAMELHRALGSRDAERHAATMLIAGRDADAELIAQLVPEFTDHDAAFALALLRMIDGDARLS
jgi:tetratricopeptide (TPR) repeat protein